MPTPARSYGGVPPEQRQAGRRDRLIDAALTVIGTDGTSALTVHRVCRTAGLNERYYYESFPERDDLVRAVAEDVAGRLIARLVESIGSTPDDARTQATTVIGAAIDLFTDDPRLGRLMVESAGHPVLSEARTALTSAVLGLIIERGVATLKIELTPAIEKDATFAATLLLGGLIEVLTAWTTGVLPLDRDELVERCVETFLLIGDRATGRG